MPPTLAVIPARGGSKRIPRKNIRPFAGRPLIAWTIDTCLRSGLFDEVVVSTDDDEIAQAAHEAGAQVPYTRPPELADDHATTADVMSHAAAQAPAGTALICCVYPAAVLVSAGDLARGRDVLLSSPDLGYAASVVRYGHPIQRALALDEDGRIELLAPELASTRTQDLEPRFHDAGQFYWGRTEAWLARSPMFASAVGIELPSWRAIDIDTEDDWTRAELTFASVRDSGLAERLG